MIKNEKNIYKIINIIVFILCNISFIYIVYFNENSNYKYIYILPLIFEICYIFLISKNISYFREFIITFSLIGFIRYVIVPVTITYNGGYNGRSPQMPSEQSFDLAIFLMIYELIVCSICIYFFSRKMKKYRQNGQNIEGITNNTIKGPKSIMIYIIFSLMIINLENAEVNVQKIPEGIRVNYLDGDVEETSKDIIISKDIGKYKIKEKKKIKIFS